jgi:hypothetical protein
MGSNTNKGYRVGAVKDRSQIYNPKTDQFIKRDSSTGKFISASNNKYKGVTVEKAKVEKAKVEKVEKAKVEKAKVEKVKKG